MSYAELSSHFERTGHLAHALAMLQWDEAVMMPEGSGHERALAMATLEGVLHERAVDPRIVDWLEQARQTQAELSAFQRANLREIDRLSRRARAVPQALVERAIAAQLRSEQAWRKLRKENDFATFAPYLEDVLKIKRELGAAYGEALGLSPYDALMDEYEPGLRAEKLDRVFGELRRVLPGLISEVIAAQASHPPVVPSGPFAVEAQAALGARIMAAIGFDTSKGRLDVSHHPFCGGVPSDVRITTRYQTADFLRSLMGVLHEAGHAKYEQGLPAALIFQPVGRARGMVMHESQSLLSEMQVSRGLAFLTFLAPLVRLAFSEQAARQPAAFTPDNLYRLCTRVERSKIRVDADEVTYPCHVILRYDLERALIEGRMQVKNLPEAWDAGMRSLLGIATGDDMRDGCMQDVHWPSGAFGYFPTYTLGAMTAAQLFAALKRDTPGLDADIAQGDFRALNAWLRTRVWSRASELSTDDLLREATGDELNPQAFERHLRARYLGTHA
jgi:carboxypeptidase Taq